MYTLVQPLSGLALGLSLLGSAIVLISIALLWKPVYRRLESYFHDKKYLREMYAEIDETRRRSIATHSPLWLHRLQAGLGLQVGIRSW